MCIQYMYTNVSITVIWLLRNPTLKFSSRENHVYAPANALKIIPILFPHYLMLYNVGACSVGNGISIDKNMQ